MTPLSSFSTISCLIFSWCVWQEEYKDTSWQFILYPGLQMFHMTGRSISHLNKHLIYVPHTLIIHVKDFFLLALSNCKELKRQRVPL